MAKIMMLSLYLVSNVYYPKSDILGHRNINSFQIKFDSIAELINWSRVDIFLINETKLDVSVPSNQFAPGYKFIRKSRKNFETAIAFYINDQLPNRHSYSDYRSNNTKK